MRLTASPKSSAERGARGGARAWATACRAGLRRYSWSPVYALVVENSIAHASAADLEDLAGNIDKYVKMRDELATRIEKSMIFLATVLVLVFFVLLRIIDTPKILDIEFSGSDHRRVYFVFAFLLIGNIIALLYATAMLKMFMVETLIGRFIALSYRETYQPFAAILFRFFPFSYALIAREVGRSTPRFIVRLGSGLNVFTTVGLPILYMAFYAAVLVQGLNYIRSADSDAPRPPGQSVETVTTARAMPDDTAGITRDVLFWTLTVANAITLPVYLFTFLPVPTRRSA